MNLTYKTLITWATLEDVTNPAMTAARDNKLQQMIAADQTDGVLTTIPPLTYERHWVDQAAADEYVQFVVTESANLGQPIPTYSVEPL